MRFSDRHRLNIKHAVSLPLLSPWLAHFSLCFHQFCIILCMKIQGQSASFTWSLVDLGKNGACFLFFTDPVISVTGMLRPAFDFKHQTHVHSHPSWSSHLEKLELLICFVVIYESQGCEHVEKHSSFNKKQNPLLAKVQRTFYKPSLIP